ncbi:MAG: glycosyltransferase family 2 protein [Desulfovibrionaceae bacterium]|nr:glycosyltransferase family 2 protein [Desulfovibrionaceae bacterium]
MPNPVLITGLVLTYNGERLLRQCLQSLSFCDRILVIDSCSTDNTAAIAADCGAEIRRRAWTGPADQFHYAMTLLSGECASEWIVSLDQDEICTDELREAVLREIQQHRADKGFAGFIVRRKSWYYDRFLLHGGWYPDRLLRCFRTHLMRVDVHGAHYSFHALGKTAEIKAHIVHYPYENFSAHLDKINAYAQQGAEDLERRGYRGGIVQGLAHGAARFFRIYILKMGFLDGRAGFINAVHGSFYAFLKYVRIGEGSWGAPFSFR